MPWQRRRNGVRKGLRQALTAALEEARQGRPDAAIPLLEGSFRVALEELRALPSPTETAWLQVAGRLEYRAGQMPDAARCLEQIAEGDRAAADWHLLGRIYVWLGNPAADRAFSRAARLDPRHHPRPYRVSHQHFEKLSDQALGRIPSVFRERLQNTIVAVDDLPPLEAVIDGEDPDLLGIYEGGTALHDDFFERIVLYQRNHETISSSEAELVEQVEETMRHEIGHHFGMSEAELPY
jgi:predicted Zn-dependent protease with MMP-like domain